MKSITELKGSIHTIKEEEVKAFPSSISIIISKLLVESKNNEMLSRLKNRLGLTKEEIHKIVSEL